jgi:glycosyltransferase involved in cell wall biosynthesis
VRVLWVTPGAARLHGGPGPAVISYIDGLRRVGIDADVAVPEPPAADRSWLADQLPPGSLRMFPLYGRSPLYFSPGLIAWLRGNAASYDVVHVCGFLNPVSSQAGHTVLRVGRPLVLHPFGALSRYTFTHKRPAAKRWYFRRFEAPLVRRASAMHFTTAAERDEALWHGIDFSRRSYVIPPAWSNGHIAQGAPRAGRRVLFLGRLHEKKGLAELLQAWPLVRKALPDAQLEIAGDGEPEFVRQLKARVLQMGEPRESIIFAGFVDGEAKTRSLAHADVFVLPSYQENFGIAVIEAVAAGLPVVITEHVQVASFIRENGLGLIIERDPTSLAGGIIRALSDASLRHHVAATGAAVARQTFAPEAIGAQLRDLYEDVVVRGNPTSL